MRKQKCECEHVCHFEKHMSPKGRFGHKYGREYPSSQILSVKTSFGTFNVCPYCVNDCMEGWPIISEEN